MSTKILKHSALLALGVLLVSAAIAVADTTRDDYVATVEPICKKNSDANSRILNGVHKLVRQGKLKAAGAKFLKAATALTATQKQLAAVPQPAADAAKLTKWLGYIKAEASLLKKAGLALKAEKKSKASNYIVTLDHDTNLANTTVALFHFHYCIGKPSSSYS
jgi:hypothetical protein